MKVIYGVNKIRGVENSVVALGVFDGVHRGHINILRSASSAARRIRGRSVAVTFWPHPQAKQSLYSLAHRLRLIEEQGIDICVVIKFNPAFARTTAEGFIKNILAGKLRAKYIYIGRNFRFGRNASGGINTLLRFSKKYNFKVRGFNVIKFKGKPVSSTYIRALIKRGELSTAGKLLTRPVSVLGTVVKGSSLARKLGYPTANINPHHEVTPGPGIYAVKAVLGCKVFNGICYIGRKPTFMKNADRHIEVHIFNFKNNIYGKDLMINFLKKIRNDRKFNSPCDLATQIKKDINKVKSLFLRHS